MISVKLFQDFALGNYGPEVVNLSAIPDLRVWILTNFFKASKYS